MKKTLLSLLVVFSLVLLAGCAGTEAGEEEPLEVVESQTVEAFGYVKAEIAQQLTLEIPAVVQEVIVREGQKVTAGDALFMLDLSEYQAQIKQKQRELKIARLELTRLSGTTVRKIQQERIAALEDEVARLAAKLKQSYFVDNQLVVDCEEGVVCELAYQAGENVTPAKKLCTILQLDSLVVEATIFEEFIKDVRLGAEVKIVPLADKSKEYQGIVTAIAAKAMQQNGETVVPVQISIKNNDGFLQPAYNVDVIIAK